jgi:hypothetical protein
MNLKILVKRKFFIKMDKMNLINLNNCFKINLFSINFLKNLYLYFYLKKV